MFEDLKRLAIALGNSIHSAKRGLKRDGAGNEQWKSLLKECCLLGIRDGVQRQLPADVQVRIVETPYNTSIIGRGCGQNEMSCRAWGPSDPSRTMTILADVVDGSWNAACGLPWSASTMLAMTEAEQDPKQTEDLVLSDFKCGLIIPLVGAVATPNCRSGFYYGVEGEQPHYRLADSPTEYPLHPTPVDDVRQTRFFLDLFTAQTYDSLAMSIAAVTPLIREWADIARFYGAGMELMSLLGTPGVTPGFGGYVAANQKADNLIPTIMLLEGAGLIVTDWWGEPISQMHIMDRRYVAIAASAPLHDHMVGHLSNAPRLP